LQRRHPKIIPVLSCKLRNTNILLLKAVPFASYSVEDKRIQQDGLVAENMKMSQSNIGNSQSFDFLVKFRLSIDPRLDWCYQRDPFTSHALPSSRFFSQMGISHEFTFGIWIGYPYLTSLNSRNLPPPFFLKN
jgi:hypothetical protein